MSFYYPDESYAKTTYDFDQQRYENPYAGQQQYQPQRQERQQRQKQSQKRSQPLPRDGNDKFMTDLCKSGGPCAEACCCYWCQLSRQYNVIFNDTKGLHCGMCCVLATFDWCICAAASMACQCYLRERLRKRYNMKEDYCSDCCTVFWCACCALSQTHWEMALRGDDPGATCTSCGDADVATQMR